MLQDEIVQNDDAWKPERGVEGITVIGAVTNLVEVEIECLPLSDVFVLACGMPRKLLDDGAVIRLVVVDEQMDVGAFVGEVGKKLFAVVGNAGASRRERAPVGELHRSGSVSVSITWFHPMPSTLGLPAAPMSRPFERSAYSLLTAAERASASGSTT